MTKYNLQEFKQWLEENPTRKENLPNWEEFLTWTEENFNEGETLAELVADKITWVTPEYNNHLAIIEKWLAERERGRERACQLVANAKEKPEWTFMWREKPMNVTAKLVETNVIW